MNNKKLSPRSLTIALSAFIFIGVAHSQEKTGDESEVYELSPFTVEADKQNGYRASSTLAGTRLKTDLKDIAASISVVTKQFLEDTGSNSIEDILVYTTGTEVTGTGGNLTAQDTQNVGQNRFLTSTSARREANARTRVRGLQSADRTRNYFTTSIPLDSYNTDRVVINRGANAILFGLGSPAGIINQSLINPSHVKKFGEIGLKLDSFGSVRGELDYNTVLAENKVAIRIAALNSDKSYEQKEAFMDDRRLFLTASFKPFEATTIRANYETASIEGRRPNTLVPVESISHWISEGKPIHESQVVDRRDTGSLHGSTIIGAFGPFFKNPGLIYGDENGSGVTIDGFPGIVDGQPARGTRSQFNGIFGGIRDWATFQRTEAHPIGNLLYNRSNTDRSFFDYRKHLMEGPNGGFERGFDTYSLNFEQLLFEKKGGIELAFDNQKNDYESHLPIVGRDAGTISIDINTHTLDGRENPNFGRPYIVGNSRIDNNNSENESFRATAFYKFDFKERFDGKLGTILGEHTVTGLFEDRFSQRSRFISRDTLSSEYGGGLGGTQISSIYYMGPSVYDANSVDGLSIPHITVEHKVPETVTQRFFNRGTGLWEVGEFGTYSQSEWDKTASTANLDRLDVNSQAAILQSKMFNGSLATIIGYREDDILNENVDASRVAGVRVVDDLYLGNPSATITDLKSDIFTYGVVLHLTDFLNTQLPGGGSMSLGYNESANTSVAGARFDLFGTPRDPASGLSNDYSLSIRSKDNKLSAKFTWYETFTLENTARGIPWQRMLDLEDRIGEFNTQAEIDATGYVQYGASGFNERLGEHFDIMNYQRGGVLDTGFRQTGSSGAAAGTTEINDLASEGLEVELIYNPTNELRFMFNVAKQESVRTNSAVQALELINEYEALLAGPAGELRTRPTDQNARDYLNFQVKVPTLSVLNQDGGPATELVEWRANLVGAYTFSEDSGLAGWGVGGALRYQTGIALGFPVINHPDFGRIEDVKNPWWGDDKINGDMWINHQRTIMDGKAKLKFQLNIRNLIGDDLVLHRVNAVDIGNMVDYVPATYRTSERTKYELTTTFSF